MKKLISLFVLAGLLVACNTTKTELASENKSTNFSNSKISNMSKKETAVAFVQAVTAQDANKVRLLANTDYIQHNPFLPTGLEPFIGLFPMLKENGTAAKAVRAIEDGQFVVLHHLWTGAKPFGADEVVTFDVLRFDNNGKIAEHWDAIMPNTPPNSSGRTLIDGEIEIKDLDKTNANKAKVKNLFHTLINGKQEEVGAVVTETFYTDYKQHSPVAGDGIPAVFEAFGKEQWVYLKQHKVIGEGNFVLSICEGTAKGIPSVFYDLVRFENGKIAEHWDVIQAIPTEGLANDNGMFGF